MSHGEEFEVLPWEIDLHAARDAILVGEAKTLASYLSDAADGMALLAELGEPGSGWHLSSAKGQLIEDADGSSEEWDGSADQLRRALQRENVSKEISYGAERS